MNKRRIEKLIPLAMRELASLQKNGKIPKVYDSYIAAFGPSVVQSGLLQCVAFYQGDDKKKRVIEIFYNLLKELEKSDSSHEKSLLDYLKNNRSPAIRQIILDVAVACKLAIRTFELDDRQED